MFLIINNNFRQCEDNILKLEFNNKKVQYKCPQQAEIN